MTERFSDNSTFTKNPFQETWYPIDSYGFVDTVIDVSRKQLGILPNALKIGNMVTNIYTAYQTMREGIHVRNRVPSSPTSHNTPTVAFNELLRAYNLTWTETEGNPIRTSPGMYVVSWLPTSQETIFESQYYPTYTEFVAYHGEMTREYFQSNSGYNSIRSIFHEIKPGSEFVAIGKTQKTRETHSYESSIVGIQESGKGIEAKYGILHRNCTFKCP